MSSPKIDTDTGPPKTHVANKGAGAETKTGAVVDPLKTDTLKPVGDASQKLPGPGTVPLKPVGDAGPPKAGSPKDIEKKSTTTNTITNTKTPDTPTPNINIINPEPKTTLSEKPVNNIVIDALKIGELANALNPNKNKNELKNLKQKKFDEKTKQEELKQLRINTKIHKAKTRKAERKKTLITKKIQTLEGKISKGKKQSRWSISLRGSYAKQLKRLQSIEASNVNTAPKVEPTAPPAPKAPTAEPKAEPTAEPKAEPTAEPTAEPKIASTPAPPEPKAPKAEPTAEPKIASTPEPTAEPTATKAEPTAPKPEPTADQVVSSAPTTPKVEETKTANTASNVIKTNSAVAVSTNSVNYSKKHKKSKDPYNLETKKLNTQYNNALHSARAKLLRNMFMEYEHVSKQNPQETDNNKLKALSDITLEKKYKEYEKEYEKDMANVNKLGNTIKTRNTQRRTQRQTQRNQSNKNYKESISNIGNLFKNT